MADPISVVADGYRDGIARRNASIAEHRAAIAALERANEIDSAHLAVAEAMTAALPEVDTSEYWRQVAEDAR